MTHFSTLDSNVALYFLCLKCACSRKSRARTAEKGNLMTARRFPFFGRNKERSWTELMDGIECIQIMHMSCSGNGAFYPAYKWNEILICYLLSFYISTIGLLIICHGIFLKKKRDFLR